MFGRANESLAIFYVDLKVFSRAKGQSATAAAAYRAGLRIADERTGIVHDYRRRSGVDSVSNHAPTDAPPWASDPHILWNKAELAEARINSRVARELVVALPAELDGSQRKELTAAMSQLLVDRYSIAVMAAIHEPGKGGDDRNHHCHLLMTTRIVGPEGFGAKVRLLDDQATGPVEVRALRESIALLINQHLASAGKSARVDSRSLVAQADDAAQRGDMEAVARLVRVPQRHEGKAATAARRRGERSGAQDANAAIRIDNRALAQFARLRSVELRQESEAKNRAGIDRKRRPRRSRPAVSPTPVPRRPRRLAQESHNPYLAGLAETVALMKRQVEETLRLDRRRGHELERELREAKLRRTRAWFYSTSRWNSELLRTEVGHESRQSSTDDSAPQSSEALPATKVVQKTINDVMPAPAVPASVSKPVVLNDDSPVVAPPTLLTSTEISERVQPPAEEIRNQEFFESSEPESARRTASQRQEHSPQSSQPQNRRQWAELRRRQRAAATDHVKREKGANNAAFPALPNPPATVFPDSTVDSRPTEQYPTVPVKPRRPRPR